VKLMRKLLKKQGFAPDLLVSDRLRSYAAAMSEMGLSARYEQGPAQEQLVENSHQPTRRGAQDAAVQIARINLEVSVTRAAAYNTFKSNAISRQLNHTTGYAPRR
jgi:transposase-like protein